MVLSGCEFNFNKDSLEDSTIYTTIYPIKYLAEFLYKDYSSSQLHQEFDCFSFLTPPNYILTSLNNYILTDLKIMS